MAAVASLCASAAVAPAALAAPGDLPDLVQQAPTNITMGHYDDHSRGGDNHMGWGFSGSDREPLAISFQASLRNAGPGVLQLCAGAGDERWRTARQTAPGSLGDCSGAAVNGASLFFRYAIANHSDETPSTFNRWHVMDLQRFALVPLPASQGGPTGSRRTIWDNQWGTCLQLDGDMACPQSATAGSLNVGISAGATKLTQEGAPDRAVIAFQNLELVPSGRYQVVAMANPYAIYREAGAGTGSVSCTNVQITSDAYAGTFSIAQLSPLPQRCWLPRTFQSRVTGAGGIDPFAGAQADSGCPLNRVDDPEDPNDLVGHCWRYIPTFDDPDDPLSPHPLGRTNVNDTRATTATDAVEVAQGATINAGTGGGTTPATPPTVRPPAVVPPNLRPPVADPLPKTIPTMTTAHGRSLARTALRRTFGTLPSSASVGCRLTGGSTAACTVSWRRASGARYRGSVRVWFSSDAEHVRWNYGMSVKRSKRGTATRTTSRTNRAGGLVS